MEEQINEMNKFFQDISVSAVDVLWHIAAALGVFLLGIVIKKLLRKLLDRLMKLRIKSHALPQARLDSLSAFAFAVYDCVAWFIIAVTSISKLGVDVSDQDARPVPSPALLLQEQLARTVAPQPSAPAISQRTAMEYGPSMI